MIHVPIDIRIQIQLGFESIFDWFLKYKLFKLISLVWIFSSDSFLSSPRFRGEKKTHKENKSHIELEKVLVGLLASFFHLHEFWFSTTQTKK